MEPAQTTLVLDSGALIGLSRGRRHLRALVAAALDDGDAVEIPIVCLAETVRGNGPRDAPLNLVIARCHEPRPLDEAMARLAGMLLAAVGGSNTIDALVVAAALALTPCVIVTSDIGDLRRLLNGRPNVELIAC